MISMLMGQKHDIRLRQLRIVCCPAPWINMDDEVVEREATDWKRSGLKVPSIIRIARVAVVHKSILLGGIGEVEPIRLDRIKRKLADWLLSR